MKLSKIPEENNLLEATGKNGRYEIQEGAKVSENMPMQLAAPVPAQIAVQVPAQFAPQTQAAIPGQARGGKELVMLEFQRSSLEMTRKFLQVQETVMLAYLRGANFNVDSAVLGTASNEDTYAYSTLAELEPDCQVGFVQEKARHFPKNGKEGHFPKNGKENYLPQSISALVPETTVVPPRHGNPGSELRMPSPTAAAPVAVVLAAPDAGAFTANDSAVSMRITTEASVSTAENKADTELSAEKLIDALIQIVSERTGYPPEMLDFELDLEADLGIDSIKRVEILNSFRKLLPESAQVQLEEGIEKLAGVKTLQGISDWIKSDLLLH